MTRAAVSIVLVTRNGGETLPAVFQAVEQQSFDGDVEIIAVDSGSTDGSLALIEQRSHRLIRIDPEAFNHGTTRNLGMEQARADYVVLMVQDAVPVGTDWMTKLVEPLRRDPSIAGAFARQQPRHDASEITRHYLARWIAASREPRVVELSGTAALDALSPADRMRRCIIDNVCACIRRDVWKRHPFRATTIAEDLEWGRDVLLAGYRLAYAPASVVTHSHDKGVMYEFRRTRNLHARLVELFDLHTIPDVLTLLRAVAGSTGLHLQLERRHPLRWPKALGLAVAWPVGQYLGGRSARSRPGTANDGVTSCAS